MGRTRTRPATTLARSGPAELADARLHLAQLLHDAAVLHASAAHDPDVARCADAGCGLDGRATGDELCALADRLAPLHSGPVARDVPLHQAEERFRQALVTSLDAVRACRQTAHRSGTCWFSPLPDVDGCSEVLRLAHRVC
jgi:hypothetical protein